ncbi:MAG: ABC transporter ATP-binding protein [bacterium]|nr:ABC transporter ATP-binding protein [bacterium]
MSEPLVHLVRLRKRFGARVALAGVDLRVEAPEILGVVGPDGAGKTTLLRALAGLLEVEADVACVLGEDLRGDVQALKARVGYVPQVFSLHRDLSVEENLRFTATLHRLSADEFAARSRELLTRTALEPFRARAAGALSGGMKMKLAVANALLPRPDLLVLDEPTAGVDVVARGEIWELLTEVRRDALVVLSTSYLDEAAGCDRLLYLDDGRPIATGTPAELRAHIGLELYRVWTDDARAAATAARALPYVRGARVTGRATRIEVPVARSPGAARVLADLAALPGARVRFVEPLAIDMESTLLALSNDSAGAPP